MGRWSLQHDVRAISRLLPRGHPLHKPAVWLFEYSGLALAREHLRARNRRNAVFLHIPKSAGTSIHVMFDTPVLNSLHLVKRRFTGQGIVSFGHMSYRKLVAEGRVPKAFDASSFKFAFCRNPYDRLVSLFAYLQHINKVPHGESFLGFCRKLHRDGFEPIGLYNARGLSQCNPQARWVENVRLDFLGRVESMNEDVRRLAEKLGVEQVCMRRENASRRVAYAGYYCRESRDIAEFLYREDFERFGYAKLPLGSH